MNVRDLDLDRIAKLSISERALTARVAELSGMLQHVVDMIEGDDCAEYQPMLADIRATLAKGAK